MIANEKQQKIAAAAFAKKWEGRGYRKGALDDKTLVPKI
jgi:hypothetical protein